MTDNNSIIYDNNFVPKIIKRNRKNKFTKKRRPYKSYNEAKWNWNDIFKEIDELKNNKTKNFLKIISIKHGIVYSTLKNKYYNFFNNKIKINNKKHRGVFIDVKKFLQINKNLKC